MKRLGVTLVAFVLALSALRAQSIDTTGLTLNVDPSESGRAWQDTAMTTPAGDGDPVRALDDSGDAADSALFAVIDATRPTYRATGINGIGAIEYPGGLGSGSGVWLVARDDAFVENSRSRADYFTTTAYTVYAVFNAQTATTQANVYDNTGPVTGSNQVQGMVVKDDGGQFKLQAWHYDGAFKTASVDIAASTNYLARARYDGTTIRLAVFSAPGVMVGGAEATVAAGSVGNLTGLLQSGTVGWGNTPAFDGLVGGILLYNVYQDGDALDDTTDALANKWLGGAAAPDLSYFTFSLMARLFRVPAARPA